MKPITIHDAFEIIINSKKIKINRQWLEQYERTKKYNELEWYYALSKRLHVYNILVDYTKQNYNINSKSPLISSPTKKPINPDDFLDYLGRPEPDYTTFITDKICSIYIKYGVIQEYDVDKLTISLLKETFIIKAVDFTNMSEFRSDPPPKSPYYLQQDFSFANKKIASMIYAILSLPQNHHEYLSTLKKTRLIENEDDSKKGESFALELCKYISSIGSNCPLKDVRLAIRKRSEHLRELSASNNRIHFISVCADIITGGILNVEHEIREFRYENNEPVDYITDKFEHVLYKLPIVTPYILRTLFTQNVIDSINIYSTEEEREKIIKDISSGTNETKTTPQQPKIDIFGRIVPPSIKLTENGDQNKKSTDWWDKDFDSQNEMKLASAWCNVSLIWPESVIIDAFSSWLKEIKKQYNPRAFGEQKIDDANRRTKKLITAMNNKKLLQYLDIKILSAATGNNLSFADDILSTDGTDEFKDIATKNSSPDRNKLLKKIFSFDDESDALRDLWLLSLI